MYLGVQVGGTRTQSEVTPVWQTVERRRAAFLGAAQVFGVQYRFLRSGFADLQFKLGYGATRYTDTLITGDVVRGRNAGELFTGLELRVGRTL
jgi:hypothetical protein